MITSTTRTAGPFLGNGSTTVFSFGFKVFLTSEVLVQQTDVSGNVTTLALTSQYTVSLNSNQDTNPGGTVTLLTALTASYLLVITSQIALIQSANLTNAGNFYPQVVNDALDRLTIIAQQQASAQSRSLTVPLTDSSSIALQLPSASSRALRALVFDASGNVSVSDDIYTNQTAAAAASATAAAGSAASAGSSATTATTAASAASASAAGAATSATASASSASSAAASAATALAAASGGGNTVTNPLIQQQFGGF